jgi:prepilin-type N-terminal cleavage/methylation domain-containing protein
MNKRVLGFTLIELMIVVAIIAIIAAIAIPGLLRARISTNEGSASASLRSLASAETNYMKSQSTDQDNDGTGEYALFNELTGATNRRGCANALLGQPAQRPPLNVTDMSVALRPGTGNFASKSGYYLQIFLPGVADAITDNGTSPQVALDNSVAAQDAAIQQQENRWICYAWPATYRSSGVRAFVCDHSAEVYATTNTDINNNGYWFGDAAANRPIYNSAMARLPLVTFTVWNNISVKDNANACDTNHSWVPAG